MKLKQLTVKQSLNKAYRLIKPERADIEKFKVNFKTLLGHINPAESEENMKGHVMDFLKNTWYNPDYHIATKGRTDFVIHTGKDASHPAGVLFEAKKPSNHEMVTLSDLNRKAMHEIILYYLRERIEHRNDNIKYLVITSIYEWFVFDAPQFEKLFYKNKFLVNNYKAWAAKLKVSANNDHFYNEIAKPFIASLADEIEFTYFDIRDYEKPLKDSDKDNDNKLIPLYKVLSPTHLLKLPFANDSNSLDKGFYNELLYIIGLEEVKEGNKKLIRRRQEGKRIDGSLLENTIVQLETENCLHKVSDRQSYGDTESDQLFSIALELCITWVNRVLFLKLLEAQLLKYHKGNGNYRFLNYKTISQYDELYKLFFQVLARKQQDRTEKVRAKYKHIPYLNSSLFDITALEDHTIRINMLDDAADMPLLNTTILKDDKNKPVAQKLNTLQYLFDFLNAYDFASEGSEEIQEERKTLINAAVLGLIFEKINGYKDGSIYTPGFITMYMCRQAIRQSVVSKFKEKYKWKVETFEDLHNYVSEDRSAKAIKEYNALVNSLTICDPAVGSGHFLVSALNELIALKSELGILADANGKRLAEHIATVENDELIVTDKERNFFTYHVNEANDKISIPNAEVQRVQETLFHEKQRLIENSLFGVDINPKSVQICRLRLWIELLKNAYYIADGSNSNGELQTLPNIDINIKTGNSLISRFSLDEDLKPVLSKSKYTIQGYKSAVQTYRDAISKEQKREMENLISVIKNDFTSNLTFRHKLAKSYVKEKAAVVKISSEINRLEQWNESVSKRLREDLDKATRKLEKLEKQIQDIQNNVIFRHSFEWRFEFPEVLDDNGDFIGFDIIIGNPPWGAEMRAEELKHIKAANNDIVVRMVDTFMFFFNLSFALKSSNGLISLIIPDVILYQIDNWKLRKKILDTVGIRELINLGDNIFQDVARASAICFVDSEIKDNCLVGNYRIKDGSNINRLGFEAISTGLFRELPNFLFPTKNIIGYKILSKLNSLQRLKDVVDADGIQRGVSPDYKDAFIVDDDTVSNLKLEKHKIKTTLTGGFDIKKYILTNTSKRLIYTTSNDNPSEIPNIISFINRYKSKITCKEVLQGKHPFYALHRERDEQIFLKPEKLIGVITSDKIIIALDTIMSYPTDGMYILCSNGSVSNKTLMALLNSKLLTYLYRLFSFEEGRVLAQIKPVLLQELPIMLPKNEDDFEEIVDQIVKEKSKDNSTDALEEHLDKMIFQLYNLSEDEIALISNSSIKQQKVIENAEPEYR